MIKLNKVKNIAFMNVVVYVKAVLIVFKNRIYLFCFIYINLSK